MRMKRNQNLVCLSDHPSGIDTKKIKKPDLQSLEMCQSISVPVIPDLKDSTSLLFY